MNFDSFFETCNFNLVKTSSANFLHQFQIIKLNSRKINIEPIHY